MNHPLRCRCGTLQGHVARSASSIRAVCYCKDCQAYARFLGTPGVVDANGGTEIVAMLPGQVHFTAGQEMLACLSMTVHGPLRWYARCCNTPVGGTTRNPKIAYAGIVHACLEKQSPTLTSSFAPLRIAVNTESALGRVPSTPLSTAVGIASLMTSAAGAWVSGAYRDNPFFIDGTSTPIRTPHVLSAAEREQAYRAPDA